MARKNYFIVDHILQLAIIRECNNKCSIFNEYCKIYYVFLKRKTQKKIKEKLRLILTCVYPV